METLIKTYTESGYKEIPSIYLSDDEYGRALQCFVPVCTDIVPIDTRRRIIYLAYRISKPMTGWWIGGRMATHETAKEAAVRNFRRETGLEIAHYRLKLVSILDYRFKDRAQTPQEIGTHTLAYTFTVELTADEIAVITANLDKVEYKASAGLAVFNRERLVEEKVFPAVLDLYDHIFPQKEEIK